MEEIFQACRHVIVETGFAEMLASGVVITGGTTLLDGMPEHAEAVIGLPVRRGAPTGIGGLIDVVRSPAYATAVGLVKYGAEHLRQHELREEQLEDDNHRGVHAVASSAPSFGSRVAHWLREVF